MQASGTPSARTSLFDPAWRNVTIGSVALCSMVAFEAIGVATGMPVVAAALDGINLYALAFAGTLAGSIVAMVWAGVDCDRHGPLRSMAWGISLFALGLLVAGLSPSMPALVVGRVIQGLGSGSLVVALYVATARTLPPSLHPRLFALFSSAWVVPAIVGPSISGWVVEYFGWRWLFLGIGALLVPTAALILPPLRGRDEPASVAKSTPPLHWPLLASASCVALATSALAGPWAPVLVSLAIATMVVAAARILPAGTMRLQRGLPTIIALRGLNSAAFFLCEAFVPLWLHQQRGWSITAAGLALTGGAISWSLGSHLQSRIGDGPRRQSWLSRGCLLLMIGITLCVMAVAGAVPDWSMLIGWSMSGLGVGLSLPMLGVLMLKLAPRERHGNYSSALQLCAALCTSAALAAGGLAFSVLEASLPMAAFLSVFVLAAAIAALSWRNSDKVAPRATPGEPATSPGH